VDLLTQRAKLEGIKSQASASFCAISSSRCSTPCTSVSNHGKTPLGKSPQLQIHMRSSPQKKKKTGGAPLFFLASTAPLPHQKNQPSAPLRSRLTPKGRDHTDTYFLGVATAAQRFQNRNVGRQYKTEALIGSSRCPARLLHEQPAPFQHASGRYPFGALRPGSLRALSARIVQKGWPIAATFRLQVLSNLGQPLRFTVIASADHRGPGCHGFGQRQQRRVWPVGAVSKMIQIS